MRLINADALIPIMKYATTDNEVGVFPIRIGFDAIKGVIDDAPTIDAVEVVRCKDCKHHEKFLFDDSKVLCWVHDTDIVVSPTDYCSFAERREESEVEE